MPKTPGAEPTQLTMVQQMDRCSVRIRTDVSTGTGFFFGFRPSNGDGDRHIPAIITNNHVLNGATSLSITVTFREPANGLLEHIEITKPISQLQVIRHPEGLDLCAIALQPLLEASLQAGKKLEIILLDRNAIADEESLKSLQTLHDVVMVGYPNGLWDQVNNKAIFRKGTTATHPGINYNGEPFFLIDMAVFPGSSGSPVILHEDGMLSDGRGGFTLGSSRTMLIGIVFAVFQHQTVSGQLRLVQMPISQNVIPEVNMPNNLGICIQARELMAIEKLLQPSFVS